MSRNVTRSPLAILGGLIVLYLAVPLVAFFVRFLSTSDRGFHVPGLFPALWVSVSCASISLALITVLGVPLAYLLARSKSRLASIIGLIVQIPLALPPLMSGVVLIYIIGPYTFLGRLFGERLTESKIGIVIAMTFVASPFLIVAARAAFTAVDQGLLDVASTLGHSDVSRFLRVAVPVAGPGIRAGMLLSWLRAFGEYGAVVILAYNPTSLPIYTYNQFSGVGLRTTLAPTALAIGVAVAVVLISRVRWTRRPIGAPAPPTTHAPVNAAPTPVRFDIDYRLGAFHLALAHASQVNNVAVLGPSGSGKSALLRSLAGLYGKSPGEFWCGETSLRNVPAEQRHVGYVAQGFSLFPHLTVWQQLLFAKAATPELASYWLSRLHLEGLETRYPSELSGGQRQRVALAQVLCSSPQILLLDEPFSALDVPVRFELRRELRRLQRETGLATLLVTHDPEEAAFLSDEVIVISEGRILQSGSSRQVFSRPASLEVARLLGISNLYYATVVANGLLDTHGALIATNPSELKAGTTVAWSVRPERITVLATSKVPGALDEPHRDSLSGTLVDMADIGTAVDLFIAVNAEFELQVRTIDPIDLQVGDRCHVELSPDAITFWPVELDVAYASSASVATP
jgi:molybdate transport system permease protein